MRDWRMTFLPQFKACVEAGTGSLMCSYNRSVLISNTFILYNVCLELMVYLLVQIKFY